MLHGKTGLINKTGNFIIPLNSNFTDLMPLSKDFKVMFTIFSTSPDVGYVTDKEGNKFSNKSYSFAALQTNNNLIYAYKYGLAQNDSVVDVFDLTGKILFDDKFANLSDLDTNNLYTFTKINESTIRFMDSNFTELPNLYVEKAYSGEAISDITKNPDDGLYYSITYLNSDPNNNYYNYKQAIYKITTITNPDTSGALNFIFIGIGLIVILAGAIICKRNML